MSAGREHHYQAKVTWTGAAEGPTRDYESYSRAHRIEMAGKPPIEGSSDPSFRGDPSRHNPEEMLVAALSACHMLWYLHLCAVKGVVVLDYVDAAEGTMLEEPRKGRMTEVVLHPQVTIAADSDPAKAKALHERAHGECFIANSMNFPVRCQPVIMVAKASAA